MVNHWAKFEPGDIIKQRVQMPTETALQNRLDTLHTLSQKVKMLASYEVNDNVNLMIQGLPYTKLYFLEVGL